MSLLLIGIAIAAPVGFFLALAPRVSTALAGLICLLLFGLRHPAATLIVGGFLTLQFFDEVPLTLPFGTFSPLAIVAFSLLAIAALALVRAPGAIRAMREIWPFALLALLAVISILWANEPSFALREAIHYVYPVAFYAVMHAYIWVKGDPNSGLRVFRVTFLLGLVVTTVGRIVGSGGSYDLSAQAFRFVDPGVYGMPIGLLVLGAVLNARYLEKKSGLGILSKLGVAAVIATASALVAATLTRAYIFGLLAALATFLWFNVRGRAPFLGTRKLAIVGVALLTLIALLAFEGPIKRRMFWNPRSITLSDIRANPGLLVDADVVIMSGRATIWTTTTRAIEGGGLLGSGAGSTRAYLDGQPLGQGIRVMHGEFPRIWAEFGVLGLLAYALFLIWVFVVAALGVRRNRGSRVASLYATTLAGAAFILVAGLAYDVITTSPGYTEYLLLFLGTARASEAKLLPLRKPSMKELNKRPAGQTFGHAAAAAGASH